MSAPKGKRSVKGFGSFPVDNSSGSRRGTRIVHTDFPAADVRSRTLEPEWLDKVTFGQRVGVGRRQVENYLAEGLPSRKEGNKHRIPWAEGFAWWLAHRDRTGGRRGPEGAELEDAKRRRELAAARLAELELAKAEGALVAREDAEGWVADLFSILAAALQRAPNQWAPKLVRVETVAETRRLLEQLADAVLAEWDRDVGARLEEDAA